MPGINVFPFDAVSGSPMYTGEMLRQTIGALAAKNTLRPIGAVTGVLPGPAAVVTLSGTSPVVWAINPLNAILDLEGSSTAGPYMVAINQAQTGNVSAANATNPRIDLVGLTLSDPAESDGSSVPGCAPFYLAGTAAPTPVAPPTPARSLVLATLSVPAAGGGSPSATRVAPYTSAAGGIIPAAGSSMYPPNPYQGQYVDDATLGLLRWTGSAWLPPFTAGTLLSESYPAGTSTLAVTSTFYRPSGGSAQFTLARQTRVRAYGRAQFNGATAGGLYIVQLAYNTGTSDPLTGTQFGRPGQVQLTSTGGPGQQTSSAEATVLLAAGTYTFAVLGSRSAGGSSTDTMLNGYIACYDAGTT